MVFGTLHTTGAAKTIDRITNAFPTNQQEMVRIQLSTVMQAVISQLLIPRIDKPGRVAVFEIMVNTPSIAALIRDNKTFRIQSDIQTGSKWGMVTLDSFLMDKYQQGMIAREEVITKSQDPTTIQAKLQELELAQSVAQGKTAAEINFQMSEEISNPLLSLIKEQGLMDDLQYEEVVAEMQAQQHARDPGSAGLRHHEAGRHPAASRRIISARRWSRCETAKFRPTCSRSFRPTSRGCIAACPSR